MALHDAYTDPRGGVCPFWVPAELWKCLFTKQPSISAIVPRPYTVTAPWTEWDIARVKCSTNETQRIVNGASVYPVPPPPAVQTRCMPTRTPLSSFSRFTPQYFFFSCSLLAAVLHPWRTPVSRAACMCALRAELLISVERRNRNDEKKSYMGHELKG